MSTLKVAAINNPSAGSGGLAISTAGLVTGGGLDLIVAQTFTTAATVNVNNCFTSTYDSYLLTFSGTVTADVQFNLRMRVSSTDAITNYQFERLLCSGASASASQLTSQTAGVLAAANTGTTAGFSARIISPASAVGTVFTGDGTDARGRLDFYSGSHTTATAYDGFTLYPNSGTMTGTVRVYGYRN